MPIPRSSTHIRPTSTTSIPPVTALAVGRAITSRPFRQQICLTGLTEGRDPGSQTGCHLVGSQCLGPVLHREANGRRLQILLLLHRLAAYRGVAVADDPAGTIRGFRSALNRSQTCRRAWVVRRSIRPVFHDPVSGKDYLYWGNGLHGRGRVERGYGQLQAPRP